MIIRAFKILSLSLFLSAIFFAKPLISSAQTYPYKFTATASGDTITATLSAVEPADQGQMKIFVKSLPFTAGVLEATCNPQFHRSCNAVKEVSGNNITWTIKGLVGGTNYNVRAEGENGIVAGYISPVIIVQTSADTINAKWPLNSDEANANNVYLSGKINNPNIADFTIILQYSRTALPPDETTPAGASGAIPAQKDRSGASMGISPDGTYGFRINNLDPNIAYSFRQIITTKSGGKEIKVGTFNSSKGIILENSASQQKSDRQRSYSLLAPLPGLSVVLDNDLCREYVAAGKPVPGGSCDNQISYFINLLIKILIGIAAVVLVVKIIFEGYQYMVTDIPYIKANAKSKLFESFFGLLLALASYLILNTINPKLVSSELNVTGIDISIDEESDTNDAEVITGPSGTTITASKCTGGLAAIPAGIEVKSSVDNKTVCKNLATKLAELKSKSSVSWRVTSTTNGKHASQCHKKGTPKTGNCLDIALVSGGNPVPANDPRWGTLCQAIASISDITFLNEASKTPGCESIRKNIQTKYGSGSHLHIIYTGA